MAIFGIGANYEGKNDMTEEFVQNGLACIGFDYDEAPALFSILKTIKIGDIIYIKSFYQNNKELIIKHIGIVTNDKVEAHSIGTGITVNWIWTGETRIQISKPMYKYNVYNHTLYEEFNPCIQIHILNKLFKLDLKEFI